MAASGGVGFARLKIDISFTPQFGLYCLLANVARPTNCGARVLGHAGAAGYGVACLAWRELTIKSREIRSARGVNYVSVMEAGMHDIGKALAIDAGYDDARQDGLGGIGVGISVRCGGGK